MAVTAAVVANTEPLVSGKPNVDDIGHNSNLKESAVPVLAPTPIATCVMLQSSLTSKTTPTLSVVASIAGAQACVTPGWFVVTVAIVVIQLLLV